MVDKTFKMRRRGFLGLLAGLPFLGRLKYTEEPSLLYMLEEGRQRYEPSEDHRVPVTPGDPTEGCDVYLNGLLMREGDDYVPGNPGQPVRFTMKVRDSDVIKVIPWRV
jgi:hypothetical protein